MLDFNLDRFIEVQRDNYDTALQEIEAGSKQSHWIWYIFPQMRGLGHSSMSDYYGIRSREEAEAYLADEWLNDHLREICQALLSHKDEATAREILGTIDAIKVRSSMTLFDAVCHDDIFAEVLDTFYDGDRCEQTLAMLDENSAKQF